jgi:hypothetical protein
MGGCPEHGELSADPIRSGTGGLLILTHYERWAATAPAFAAEAATRRRNHFRRDPAALGSR